MSVLVLGHPDCASHDPGPGHPESPARVEAVTAALRAGLPDLAWREAPQALRSQLMRVHEATLLDTVLDTRDDRLPLRLDPDTVLGRGSRDAALRATGAAIAAVDEALAGGHRCVFCAVRPPGHHAGRAVASGFCLLNTVAVAAAHALDAHGLERLVIADFDVHHGNGTQEIFESDGRVLYLSSHQMPLYPGTGSRAERGVGNVVNQPLAAGASGEALRMAWRDMLLPAADDFRPQLILVSAGFDAHRLDPLAAVEADSADFAWLGAELVALARRHAAGRIVSVLEGGYSMTALRECVLAYVGELARP